MRHLYISFIFFICSSSFSLLNAQNIDKQYIEKWKEFYPSKAVEQGFHSSIFNIEDFSFESIYRWVKFNQTILTQLEDSNNAFVKDYPIDARLLKIQTKRELQKWKNEAVYRHSLHLYTDVLEKAVRIVEDADYLNPIEKDRLICDRFSAMSSMIRSAQENLESGDHADLLKGLKSLKSIEKSLKNSDYALPKSIKEVCPNYEDNKKTHLASIILLIDHVNNELLPDADQPNQSIGSEKYAEKLSQYLDASLTPKVLANMALAEIELVRELILQTSKEYIQDSYPNLSLPRKAEKIIRIAFDDMEKDAPKDGQEYLNFWQDLSAKATLFIEEKEIATLPKNKSLRIIPAPENAGAAARIGWVQSAPPFAPNPMTILYLPSVPDTLAEQEKVDFWSSFNKPFNRMIVIHELFPGHYMQIKISRESPHPVRLLFPYGLYFEGWATFCERVALDAGWMREDKLTFLAHLRKRLENANRAYTSVMAHCEGWDEEKVVKFSIEQSLLAPQFAKSLWGRLMRSPMQMTSYFYGGQQFTELLEYEQNRLGDSFILREFMDTIMRSGPIPIDEFYTLFAESY